MCCFLRRSVSTMIKGGSYASGVAFFDFISNDVPVLLLLNYYFLFFDFSSCPPVLSCLPVHPQHQIRLSNNGATLIHTQSDTHTQIKENNVSDTSRTPVVKFNKTFYHMFMLATCLQSSQKRKFLSNQPIHWVLIRQPIGQIQRQSFTNHMYCLSACF